MTNQAPIRRPRTKGNRLRCALCGSSDHVERHHLGGRFHVAWFVVPLCRTHHVRLTAFLRLSGVDMRYTADARERRVRVWQALLVFVWMLVEWERNNKEP